jgi:hypothetical protein
MSKTVDTLVEALGSLRVPDRGLLDRQLDQQDGGQHLLHPLIFKLNTHRVVQPAATNLETLKLEDGHVLGKVLRCLRAAPIYQGRCPQKTRTFLQSLPGGHRILFIKGAATSLVYPAEYRREFDDVDVIVESFEALWPILDVVGENYHFDLLKIYKYKDGGTASLDLQSNPLASDLLRVDVHVGGYHLWGANRLEIDLWKRARPSPNGLIPSPEDCLLMTCAHVATGWCYRLRDLNDIRQLSRSGALDWDYIQRTAAVEVLDDILAMLLTEAERVYGEDLAPAATKRRLSGAVRLFARRNFATFDWLAALTQQTCFTFPRYVRAFGIPRALLESARNGLNLLRYENRAFAADDRRRIRRIRPNEVLVLTPISRGAPRMDGEGRPILGSSFRVVDEHMLTEHFLTPYGVFVQAGYHGRVGNKSRLRMHIAARSRAW